MGLSRFPLIIVFQGAGFIVECQGTSRGPLIHVSMDGRGWHQLLRRRLLLSQAGEVGIEAGAVYEPDAPDGTAFLDYHGPYGRLVVILLAGKDQLVECPPGEAIFGMLRAWCRQT
jgi:hypothetical protein